MMDILRTSSITKVRDGAIAAQFDAELVRIHNDCMERPRLKKPRKVVLEITITPSGEDDPLDSVDVEFQVKATLPPVKLSRPMKSIGKRNGFAFDADTDDIDHATGQRRLSGIDDDGDGDEI